MTSGLSSGACGVPRGEAGLPDGGLGLRGGDGVAQATAVERRVGDAGVSPAVQVRELGVDDGGLEGVEAEVAADDAVVVAGGFAVDPEGAQPSRPVPGSSRDDDPAVAVAAEVLGGVEGEAAVVAGRAGAVPAVPGADRLGGVLDDGQAAAAARSP